MAEEESFEISYEKSEVVRHSMIPLIEDAVEEFTKLFAESKKNTTFANNVLRKNSKGDDYKIDAILHVEMNNWEGVDVETMQEMLQSYRDEANIAKRDAALKSEQNLNLQSRLSSTEIANSRLTKVLDNLETKFFALLQKLNKEESTRITLVRDFKDLNDKLTSDKKILKKDLSSAKKDIYELQAEKHKMDIQRKQMETELHQLRDRTNRAEKEAEILQSKLADAQRRESESNAKLRKAESDIESLKHDLENEKHSSRTKMDKIQSDGKRTLGDTEYALTKEINSYKFKCDSLHAEYSNAMEEHRKVTRDAIARLTEDIEALDASRMKYYKQYKDLLQNLNDHKRKISNDVLRATIVKLTTEYNNDQLRTTQVKRNLQTIDLNGISNMGGKFLGAIGSDSSLTDEVFRSNRSENHSPPRYRIATDHARSYNGRIRTASLARR